MTRDEFSDLFELRVRGAIAAAFAHARLSPGDYWPMLRGEEEVTMRAIGEIGHVTGCVMELQLTAAPQPSQEGEG